MAWETGEQDASVWNTDLEFDSRALVGKKGWEEEECNVDIGRCFQCGRDGRGDLDQTDGHFYCNDCWGAFEVWRSSQPMNVNAGRHQTRGSGGADIPA